MVSSAVCRNVGVGRVQYDNALTRGIAYVRYYPPRYRPMPITSSLPAASITFAEIVVALRTMTA